MRQAFRPVPPGAQQQTSFAWTTRLRPPLSIRSDRYLLCLATRAGSPGRRNGRGRTVCPAPWLAWRQVRQVRRLQEEVTIHAHAHRLAPEPVRRRVAPPRRHDEPADATRHGPTDPATVRADVIIRLPRVQDLSGLDRSTIYRLMSMQLFPSAVRLGRRAVGRRLSDIAACSAPRPGLASPDPAAMLQGLCDPLFGSFTFDAPLDSDVVGLPDECEVQIRKVGNFLRAGQQNVAAA